MKTLPTVAAASIVLALVLSPMVVFAAGSITFTNPLGNSYSGSQAYTISGNVSPTPTTADQVGLIVKNPNGITVDVASVPVSLTTGAFSDPTAVGGTSSWVTGIYTVTATDSNGATATTTFFYTASGPSPSSGFVTVLGPTLVFPGQATNVFIWSSCAGSINDWYVSPTLQLVNISSSTSRVSSNPGGLVVFEATFTLPSSAPDGVYLVGALVTNSTSGCAASNIGSFTVNAQVATAASVTALGNTITAKLNSLNASLAALSTKIGTIATTQATMSGQLTALDGKVTSVQGAQTAQGNQLTSISSQVGTINTGVTSLGTKVDSLGTSVTAATTAANHADSDASNVTTYVLVVAVLAAITLVLELAILVRKIS